MKSIIIAVALFLSAAALHAQITVKTNSDSEFTIVLGVNIGATAPVPIPEEVRKIKSYNPKFNPRVGFNFLYHISKNWGIGTGATVDWKGMRVKDEVKYMYTSVTENNGESYLTGYFVGKNMTDIQSINLIMPLYGTYTFNDKWRVKLGVYGARVISNTFEGEVSDGYIRVGSPVGTKQEIDIATFDFSDDARDYDFGLLTGANYSLTNRIGVYADLSWGLVPYFYSKTNPIQFRMTNIYGTLGISYKL